jgi:hypothetical protein
MCTRAADLALTVGEQAARDRETWEAGYRYAAQAFYDLGEQAGRARADELAALRWRPIAEQVHRIADLPEYAELLKRRAAPGGASYYAAVLRNGGTEFGGVGKPRVPVSAEVCEAAVAWVRREVPQRTQAVA